MRRRLEYKLLRKRVSRLKTAKELLGRFVGPAFMNPSTLVQSSTAEMNETLLELLGEILEEDRDLFAVDVRLTIDLQEMYNVFRSFRRGLESRAVEKNVSEGDRYIVNRWRRKERAGASKISLTIDQAYVDVSLAIDPILRYTAAM
jgi:hypothetical protein